MARGIVIIILSFGVLAWPQVGLGQETIYTWVDSKGTVHYSDTPTREARSINDELPPAASFGMQPDSVPQSETPPPALPAQGVTADAAADASEREGYLTHGMKRLKAAHSDETKILHSVEMGRSAQTTATPTIERIHRTQQRFQDRWRLDRPTRGSGTSTGFAAQASR